MLTSLNAILYLLFSIILYTAVLISNRFYLKALRRFEADVDYYDDTKAR